MGYTLYNDSLIYIVLHFIGYMDHAEYKFWHFEKYWADS